MTAWLTRWRLALRIARRDARRHKARSALILTMLMLPALATSAMLVLTASATPSAATYVAAELGSAAQAKVLPRDVCPVTQSVRADEYACRGPEFTDQAKLTSEQLVQAAGGDYRPVASSMRMRTLRHGDRAAPHGVIHEVDAAALPGLVRVDAGRLPAEPGEILLSTSAAEQLGAAVGDQVAMRDDDGLEKTVTAVGVGVGPAWSSAAVAAPGTVTDDGDTTVPVEFYLVGTQPVTWQAVQRLNTQGYVVLSRDVVLNPPADAPKPGSLQPASESVEAPVILAGFVGIALIEVTLIIGPAFAVGARRARRTLALLSATGAEPREQGRVVRAGGLLLGAIAGVIGVAIGVAAMSAIVAKDMASAEVGLPNLIIPWPLLVAVVPAVALLGMLAAWLPGRAVTRLDATVALREGPDSASQSRAVSWPGLALLLLGVAGAVAGGLLGAPMAAMAGGIGMLLGIVLLAGSIVNLIVRLAPRAGVAGRIALRDAARHRSRTAPALAAVIACVAGGTVGLGYTLAMERAEASMFQPKVATGLITIADDESAINHGEASLTKMVEAVQQIAPAQATKAYVVDGGAGTSTSAVALCPGVTAGDDSGELDNRCGAELRTKTWGSGDWAARGGSAMPVLVDDGTLIGAIGLPGAAEAARALRDGKVLVNDAAYLADGKATIAAQVTKNDAPPDDDALSAKVLTVPAVAVTWKAGTYDVVLSPQVAKQLGLGTWLSGYLLVPDQPLTAEQQGRIAGIAQGSGPQLAIVEAPPGANSIALFLVAALAALIAAAATWIAVGLAAADSRTDLASLAAVGASPGTRRRFAGAQAGVIAGTGAVIGTLAGLLVLWVVVTIQAGSPDQEGYDWVLEIPWLPQLALAVGVPALAIVGAMLATRSRLPALTRRLT